MATAETARHEFHSARRLPSPGVAYRVGLAVDPPRLPGNRRMPSASEIELMRGTITRREMQVLEQLCDGRSNREIAALCDIRPLTVKQHLANLYRKVGASNRSEIIVAALRLRLVTPPWLSPA